MKTCKRFGALLLALILTLSLSVTAYAAVEDTGFSDVAADAWYADAVTYVRDNGLMSGTSDKTFTPGGTMTRGMLVTTLYRMAGSPRCRMRTWVIPLPMCRATPGTPAGSTGPGWPAWSAGTQRTSSAPMIP